MNKINLQSSQNKNAVVIGGGIAGLLAAKALADRFEEVIIIERDCLSEKPQSRNGVPQSNQPHLLLSKGREILEDLFPGLGQKLIEKNSTNFNLTNDFSFLLTDDEWAPRFNSDLTSIGCSRNLLESTIRDFISQLEGVKILENSVVTKLLANEDNSKVTGIQITTQGDRISEINADLIVDASGRNSQAPQWLENLGYQKPEELKVDCKIAYASRVYRRPEQLKEDWKGLFVRTEARYRSRGGAIFPIENDSWMVVLAGRDGDSPSTKEGEFLQFARSLVTPTIYNAIKAAEPLTDIKPYEGLKNTFKQYHSLERFPENFVVLGDAVCTFNPVYGRGITVAALEAVALANCVSQSKGNLAGVSRKFQKQLSSIVKTTWAMATEQDLAWDVNYKMNPIEKIKFNYLRLVQKVSVGDRKVWQTFVGVLNLKSHPIVLFAPNILRKVALYSLQKYALNKKVEQYNSYAKVN